MASTMETWNTDLALASDAKMATLITPYNVPKSVNVLIKSNKKVLLGAIEIDNLRSKSGPNGLTGSIIIHKPIEQGGLALIGKQPIEFKANRSALKKSRFELIRPVVIEADTTYRIRLVFDSSWVARNFYCLTKNAQYNANIDSSTTISITPEKMNGDVLENELPLILYFNRL